MENEYPGPIITEPKRFHLNKSVILALIGLAIILSVAQYAYIFHFISNHLNKTAAQQYSAGKISSTTSSQQPTTSNTPTPGTPGTPGNPYAAMHILPPAGAFNILNYGASTNSNNNLQAIQKAIDAAAINDGTVYVPDGTYNVYGTIFIHNPITLEGEDRASVILMETKSSADLIDDRTNNTTVRNLTLNTQQYDGGHTFGTGGSYTTLMDMTVLSGHQPGHFDLYFAGPPTARVIAPVYSQGNTIENIVDNEQICDDGISWSFQQNGTIDNVAETGSRLALFIDNGDTINNFTFYPGQYQQANCKSDITGFWITPPSENITINNFTSYAMGGKLTASSKNRYSSNININNEVMANPGFNISIGDVTNMKISNSNFLNNTILVNGHTENISISNTKASAIKPYPFPSGYNVVCQNVSPFKCN